MRTLVIGLPLPHQTFDNHTFFSAPSLADYNRIIVDMEAVTNAVAEVASASAEHKTYTGLPVRNGESTTDAMGLADALAMRAREAEWLLQQGGVLCAFAHPDVAVKGIRGERKWRRYSWLPSPPDFSYEQHLYPSFGKAGAQAADDHPFARYIREFARTAGYRVRLNENAPGFDGYARVFARSEGGGAIAAELSVLSGTIILLPPLIRMESDRSTLAKTLLESFDELTGHAPQTRENEPTSDASPSPPDSGPGREVTQPSTRSF